MGLFAKAESLRDPADEQVPPPTDAQPEGVPGTAQAEPLAEGPADTPPVTRNQRRQGLLSRSRGLAQPTRSGGLLKRSSRLAVEAAPVPTPEPRVPDEGASPTALEAIPEETEAAAVEVTRAEVASLPPEVQQTADPAPVSEYPEVEVVLEDAPAEDAPEPAAAPELAVELAVEPATEPFAELTIELAAEPAAEEPMRLAPEPPAETVVATVPPPAGPTLPQRLAAVSSEILDAKVGLEAPGVLFSLLQRAFGLAHAAILVPDAAREVYAPWAADGLDRTSLRRLRLDGQTAAKLGAGVVEGEALTPWLKLFSTRDASTIERLHHWPCPSDEGVSAVIIAAQIAPELESDPVFHDNLEEVLEAAGHALADRREREIRRVQSSSARNVTAAPEQVIGEALASSAHRDTVLVRMTLSPLLTEAERHAPSMDRFRLTQDIALLLAHLTRETAEVVIAASPEELYLLFHGAKSLDTDLWTHALLLSLSPLLPTLERIPELPTRSIRCPKEGATALALMTSLG